MCHSHDGEQRPLHKTISDRPPNQSLHLRDATLAALQHECVKGVERTLQSPSLLCRKVERDGAGGMLDSDETEAPGKSWVFAATKLLLLALDASR